MNYIIYFILLTGSLFAHGQESQIQDFELVDLLILNQHLTDKESSDFQQEISDLHLHIRSLAQLYQGKMINKTTHKSKLSEATKKRIIKEIQPEIEHLQETRFIRPENELVRLGILYHLHDQFDFQSDATQLELLYFYQQPLQEDQDKTKTEIRLQIENRIVESLSNKISDFTLPLRSLTQRDFSTITKYNLFTQLISKLSETEDQYLIHRYLIDQLELYLKEKPDSKLRDQLIDQIMLNLSLHKMDPEQFKRVLQLIIQFQIYKWQDKASIPYRTHKGYKFTNHDIAEVNPLIIRFFEELLRKKFLFLSQITDISFLHQLSRQFAGKSIELEFINRWTEYWAKNSLDISISDRMYLKSMNLDYLMIPRITCESIF